jgi:CDP-glucose 4,6-dehydratase
MDQNKNYNILKKFYKNKKILITGATGFKGAWLSFWLYKMGAKVYTNGNNPNKNKNLFYGLGLEKKTNLNIFDIRNFYKLNKLIKRIKPSVVFHLAAQPLILKSYEGPRETYEINTMGTLNLLEASRKNDSIKSLICITSDKCYESNYSTKGFKETDRLGGKDPYSGSKASAEIIINTYNESFFNNGKLGLASARAGNVIGGGDWSDNRLIPDAINSINKNKSIILRNPKFNRPWQHVLEPLYGYLLLGYKLHKDKKTYSGAWNFGTKQNTVTNVEEVVKKIINYWGAGKYKVKSNNTHYEQTNLQLNINKAQKILKWTPTLSINESIKLTVEWYKSVLISKEKYEKITEKQIRDFLKIKTL